MKKKIVSALLALLLVAAGAAIAVGTGVAQEVTATISPNLKVVIDEKEQAFKDVNGNAVYPMVYSGTTYLPLRTIGGLMGKEVAWDGENYSAILSEPARDVRPEFKAAMDEYAALLDEYLALAMKAEELYGDEAYEAQLKAAMDEMADKTLAFQEWGTKLETKDENLLYLDVSCKASKMSVELIHWTEALVDSAVAE